MVRPVITRNVDGSFRITSTPAPVVKDLSPVDAVKHLKSLYSQRDALAKTIAAQQARLDDINASIAAYEGGGISIEPVAEPSILDVQSKP